MSAPVPFRRHASEAMKARAPRIREAIDMAIEISARARAMKLGLVAYPVEDIELILEALTGRKP